MKRTKPGPARPSRRPRDRNGERAQEAKAWAGWDAEPRAWAEVWWACPKHSQHETHREAEACMRGRKP